MASLDWSGWLAASSIPPPASGERYEEGPVLPAASGVIQQALRPQIVQSISS
jgi:hypothetical protein